MKWTRARGMSFARRFTERVATASVARIATPDHSARDGSPKLTGRSSGYSRNIARDVGNPSSAIIARISNHSEKFAASLATTLSDRCGSAVAQ